MSKTLLLHPGIMAQRHKDRLQLIELAPDDQARWEHFIDTCPAGHLLQCWAWGELKRACGWSPLRIALWDAAEERLLAGAQILLRPLPFTSYSLAYIPKGPVMNWDDGALCQMFFSMLHSFLRARQVAVLRIEPDVAEHICPPYPPQGNGLAAPSSPASSEAETLFGGRYSAAAGSAVVKRLSSMGFRRTHDHVQVLRTIAVDLAPDEQIIIQRQKPKWRYNTRLAERKGVTIRPALSLEEVRRWYSLLEITRHRDRFAGHTASYYQRAWALLRASNQAQLFLAEQAGKLLAGAFITRVGKQGIYLYGAAGNEGRNLMPNHLLQWEAMRWAKAQGATLYDLWGIADTDDPTHPEAGLTFFKRGWGGQVVTSIGAFDYIYAPAAYHLFMGERAVMRQITALRAYLRRRKSRICSQ